ncbi:hypothetical protein HY061_01160 [Candidatus Azambacteria bacterium]|nr:hypothetical protein [Candidatus Azambacteria bacterium]
MVPLVFSGNVYVYAGTTVTEGGGTTTVTEGGGGCPTGATQTSGSVSIPNPLCAKSFTDLANTIAFFMLKVASPIAIIMVIWSGLLFMTSGGDETKVKSAKDTLLWTIVAIVVIALSFSVTSILNSLLK